MIAYPNPAASSVTVKYFSQEDGSSLMLDVIDLKGNALITQKVTTTLGFNAIKLDITKLQSGVYIVKTLQGNKVATNKITKIAD